MCRQAGGLAGRPSPPAAPPRPTPSLADLLTHPLPCLPTCFVLQVRPPVEHQWGCTASPVHGGGQHAPVSVFRHRLLQLFQLSIFCKLPVLPISTLEDLRWACWCGCGRVAGVGAVLKWGRAVVALPTSTSWRTPVAPEPHTPKPIHYVSMDAGAASWCASC